MKYASASPLDAHCRALAQCRVCGLPGDVSPIVSGALRPKAMLVGQAPGKVEAAGGVPFAGRAGKTLFRWFERVGLSEAQARKRIYIAAITRCYPGPSRSGRGDRVPSPSEQEACSVWLERELDLIRPRLVIPVGRLAMTRFLPDRPLDELVGAGWAVEHAGGTSLAIPLPHPSGASSWVHQGDHAELLARALGLIGRELEQLGLVDGNGPPTRSVA